MKRDIIDLILHELLKVQNYAEYKYRELYGIGLRLMLDTHVDVKEEEEYIRLKLQVEYALPKWMIEYLAKLRKMRMLKLPKPHPLTKQKIREMEESAKRVVEELKESLEE